jgi:hypothetical protein
MSHRVSQNNRLYKITHKNKLKRVLFEDEYGTFGGPGLSPVGTYPVNDDYVIITFGHFRSFPQSGYLVNLHGCSAYPLGEYGALVPPDGTTKQAQSLLSDSNGKYYYIAYDLDQLHDHYYTDLIRLDIQDPSNIITTVLQPESDSIYMFTVDKTGDVLYNGKKRNSHHTAMSGLLKTNGNSSEYDITPFIWTGLDQNIYYYDYYDYTHHFHRLLIDGDLEIRQIYGDPVDENFAFGHWPVYQVMLDERIVRLQKNRMFQLYDSESVTGYYELDGIDIKSIYFAAGLNNYYYIGGETETGEHFLIKVDGADDSWEHCVPMDTYKTYRFTLNHDDSIILNGERLTDGKTVVVKIDTSTNISLLNDTIVDELYDLVRVR